MVAYPQFHRHYNWPTLSYNRPILAPFLTSIPQESGTGLEFLLSRWSYCDQMDMLYEGHVLVLLGWADNTVAGAVVVRIKKKIGAYILAPALYGVRKMGLFCAK